MRGDHSSITGNFSLIGEVGGDGFIVIDGRTAALA